MVVVFFSGELVASYYVLAYVKAKNKRVDINIVVCIKRAAARAMEADAPTKAQRSAPMVRVLCEVGAGADSATVQARSDCTGSPKP